MELWITENQTPNLRFSCKASETLRVERTSFQDLLVVTTEQFGRMLMLDDMVMTTEIDEFVYHEMITMVALNAHPSPRKVLIIGGGDGGTLREVTRHPQVEQGVLVEIDDRVIQASRDFFPTLSCAFDGPKAQVVVDDGIKYVKEHKNEFDVILIDSTEPVGPAIQLFSPEFYASCYAALKEDGMMVAQSESPFFNREVVRMVWDGIGQSFPIVDLYLANIPTYPSGLYSFTVGSKKHDPRQIMNDVPAGLKYYNRDVHKGAFDLPVFVGNIIGRDQR
ncbi:MAG TPA: polyamine aminopropyltransferase [Syntrophomonas sp.]|nr:polyamine aminopropyltransferase [Syntrophomonas sp.]